MSKELNQHLEQAEGAQGEPLPYWEPCNPACDPELNGFRDRKCNCAQARAALAQPSPAPKSGMQRAIESWEELSLGAHLYRCCVGVWNNLLPEEEAMPEYRELRKAMDDWENGKPSPAPELEQVERFEPAHGTDRGGNVFAYMIDNEAGEYMEFAQHDRIIGALRAEIDEVDGLSKRLDDLLHQTAIALRGTEPALTRYGYADLPLRVKTLVDEHDATRARVAELEAHCIRLGQGDAERYWENRWRDEVAQAGQVPEGYLLITQDQVERHATTAWECPPQSRVVLVSTLKRLHEKNVAAPQQAGGE